MSSYIQKKSYLFKFLEGTIFFDIIASILCSLVNHGQPRITGGRCGGSFANAPAIIAKAIVQSSSSFMNLWFGFLVI